MYKPGHFKPSEFSNYEKMDESTIRLIDSARSFANTPFIITSDFRNGTGGSAHYIGKAVDFVTPYTGYLETAMRIVVWSIKHNKEIGLGLYPFWSYKNKRIGGLHIDNNRKKHKNEYWLRDKSGKYIYDFSFDNILCKVKEIENNIA